MQSTTKFVGLDVSKEKISVAIADAGGQSSRYYGSIPIHRQRCANSSKNWGRHKTDLKDLICPLPGYFPL